ncbi:MAG: hypothetical protein ACOYM3_05920 [Terrimicrobiaceae bacterium]
MKNQKENPESTSGGCEAACSAVTFAGGTDGCDLIVFKPSQDPASGAATEIHRLQSVHGVSKSDRTDLVCYFVPLRMKESAIGVWDLEAAGQSVLSEFLSLTGGTSGGAWKWTDSPMALGATVVGGGCGGGCSSAPAASSCCGGC